MKLCKRIFRIALLTFIILMLMSGTVLAAYSYYATVQVQETGGNSYSYLPIIADIDNDYLADNGYISLTGLDTRILSGSTELEHLVVDDKVLFAIPSVAAYSTGNYRYTLGNDPLSDFPIITGVGGYITIGEDAALRLGDDFEIEVKGWVDTASGADKNIVNKADAFKLWVSDTEEISSAIMDTSTNALQDLKFSATGLEDPTAAAKYIGVMGTQGGGLSTEDFASVPMPTDGTFSRLRINLVIAPGSGNSWTFTLMKNGAPTSMVIIISATSKTGTDLTHTVDYSAGDNISLKCLGASVPQETNLSGAISFEPDVSNETIFMYSYGELVKAGDNTNDIAVVGGTPITTDEIGAQQLFVGSATIKDLYVKLTIDPGTSPDAYTFTLRKNGVNTSLTTTIVADNVTGNDTVNTVSVSTGDLLNVRGVAVDTPADAPRSSLSMVVLQDTDHEQQILSRMSTTPNTSSTRYSRIQTNTVVAWTTVETDIRQVVTTRQTLSDFNMKLVTAPGGGKSWVFTVLKNGVATDITITISGLNTTGTDSTHTATFVPGDEISLRAIPSGTPADAGRQHWGLLVTTTDYLVVVIATGISSGVRTVKTFADGSDLTIEVYDEDGFLIRSDVADLGGNEVPIQATDWILSENEVMPYIEYYKHTVSDTLIAWYQPISMIIGTNLDDRAGTDIGEDVIADNDIEEDATITWGTNPAALSVTMGSLIASTQPEMIVPASEEGAIDIVPEGEVPVTGGVVNVGKLDNNPLYFVVEIISEYTHYTEEQIWFIGATMLILIGMGISAVKVPNHLLLAGTVGLVAGGFFTAMQIYQWWMMLIFGFMFVMTILMERKPAF